MPGSHHAQFTDVLHRQHAVVEDGVRAGKSMGLRNLPSKTWVVNCGWVLAANIAADLAAWCRLLGLYDQDDLKDAEPGTLRYRLLSLPARLVRHARARVLKISRTWPWKEAFLACWQRLSALPAPARYYSRGFSGEVVGSRAVASFCLSWLRSVISFRSSG